MPRQSMMVVHRPRMGDAKVSQGGANGQSTGLKPNMQTGILNNSAALGQPQHQMSALQQMPEQQKGAWDNAWDSASNSGKPGQMMHPQNTNNSLASNTLSSLSYPSLVQNQSVQ
jgi:hypothetical protein